MSEISTYLEAIKERFDLTSDYTLAAKLGITQPEANLIRRGLKIPKPELCIKIAKLFKLCALCCILFMHLATF